MITFKTYAEVFDNCHPQILLEVKRWYGDRISTGDTTVPFMEYFGGDVHFLEVENDLATVFEDSDFSFDEARWFGIDLVTGQFQWLLIIIMTCDSGGHSYIIPRGLVEESDMRKILENTDVSY